MAKRVTYKNNYRDYLEGRLKLETYQKVGIIFLIVVIAGLVGWLYEFLFTFVNEGTGQWYMKGGNLLPWMNIYAIGALCVIPLTYKVRKYPWAVFVISFFVTGLVELVAGWLVYTLGDGTRYWDYNGEPWNFGNIGGFVCFLSATFFAIGCLALVYIVVPFCVFLARRMSRRDFLILAVTLFTLVMLDEVTNLTLKNLGLPTAMDFYESLGWEYR
ncbi:MAG: putative ABC transporter permease [Candidatus Saccharibacteria bacterium]|nr:putative ABC transporter permease [Candidatus Saccharibacteria bacterium]